MRLSPKITIYRKSWDARKLKLSARKEAASRLSLAAQYIRAYIVRSISKPYPPASSPGEPPHARSGRLRGSVVAPPVSPNELVARVGATVEYAPLLEKGTKKMSARPFFGPALRATRNAVIGILTRRPGGKWGK